MAVEPVKLDDLRRVSGQRLLEMTDEVGFGALGAAWIYDRMVDRWWFLLVSPMIDSRGPRWVYERLLGVFSKLSLPEGITPLDIRVASPREQFFRTFPIKIVVPNELGMDVAMDFHNLPVDGLVIDSMHAYRMQPLDQRAGDRARTFDAKVRELMAA